MKKVWTAQEEQVIMAAVKDCPEKLTTAFVAASFMIDRTPAACRTRYYKHIKHSDSSSESSAWKMQNWKQKLLTLFRRK
jgi:hypothetical protein